MTEEVKTKQGGYQAIYKKGLDTIRAKLYEDGVRTFEESHKQDFSWIDEIGETWGQRGVFRKTFRMVLYADDA